VPADAARPEGLAVAALVAAVISLPVPVLPAIMALVLAAAAARRNRAMPAGARGGRGLVRAACALSVMGLLVWAGLATLVVAVPTRQAEPMALEVPIRTPRTDAAPTDAAPTPTASGLDGERRWLEAITTLHTTLDEPFTVAFDLTPAKMESLAKVFRGCSRELARLGSPSDRLQPVHALVKTACAHYDKAARCFATAARYGTPDAGSSADLTQTQAFNCAAAAHEAGTTLLAEAEEKGFEIWGAPG
jgi:hypothetical protein